MARVIRPVPRPGSGPDQWWRQLRLPPRPATTTIAAVAVVGIWASTGWSGLALAVAVVVMVVVAAVTRALAGALTAGASRAARGFPLLSGLVTLTVQAQPAPVVLAVGLVLAALAWFQPSPARQFVLAAGAAVAMAGLVATIAVAVGEARPHAARASAENAISRGHMLPQRPAAVAAELMNAIARVRQDADQLARPSTTPPLYSVDRHGVDPARSTCLLLFDEHGQAAWAAAWRQPDCPSAIRAAAALVSDPDRYGAYESTSVVILTPSGDPPSTGTTTVIDTCRVRWRDGLGELLGTQTSSPTVRGPAIGRLTVQPFSAGGFIVTDVVAC